MDWWKFKVSDRKMKMRLVGDVHNAALLNKILGYPPNFITEKEKTQDKTTGKESTKEKAQDTNKESTMHQKERNSFKKNLDMEQEFTKATPKKKL